MQLDLFTVLIIEATIAILLGMWMLLFAHIQQTFRGGFWIGMAYILMGTGCALIASRNILSDMISIVLANTLVVAGMACLNEGLIRIIGKGRGVPGLGIMLTTSITLLSYYYGVVHNDLQIRIITSSTAFALLSIVGIIRILVLVPKSSPASAALGITAWLLVVSTITSAYRILMSLKNSLPEDFMMTGQTEAFVNLIYSLFVVLTALNFMWMGLHHTSTNRENSRPT